MALGPGTSARFGLPLDRGNPHDGDGVERDAEIIGDLIRGLAEFVASPASIVARLYGCILLARLRAVKRERKGTNMRINRRALIGGDRARTRRHAGALGESRPGLDLIGPKRAEPS